MITTEQNANTVTVTVKRTFHATAERVFDAWLDPDKASRFLFTHPGSQKIVRAEIDARVGGRYLFVARRNGKDSDHFGEYLEIDRPHRLVFTFQVPAALPQTTQVRIDIVPVGEDCELTLTHTGVPGNLAAAVEEGWKTFIELQDDQTTDAAALTESTRRSTGWDRKHDKSSSPPHAVTDGETILAIAHTSASPARVFQALTTKEMETWWGSPDAYQTRAWEADLRVGGQWSLITLIPDGTELPAHGEFLEIDAPGKLVHTRVYDWEAPQLGQRSTVVTYKIDAVDGATRISVRHDGFAGMWDSATQHVFGWERFLTWLAAYCEQLAVAA